MVTFAELYFFVVEIPSFFFKIATFYSLLQLYVIENGTKLSVFVIFCDLFVFFNLYSLYLLQTGVKQPPITPRRWAPTTWPSRCRPAPLALAPPAGRPRPRPRWRHSPNVREMQVRYLFSFFCEKAAVWRE